MNWVLVHNVCEAAFVAAAKLCGLGLGRASVGLRPELAGEAQEKMMVLTHVVAGVSDGAPLEARADEPISLSVTCETSRTQHPGTSVLEPQVVRGASAFRCCGGSDVEVWRNVRYKRTRSRETRHATWRQHLRSIDLVRSMSFFAVKRDVTYACRVCNPLLCFRVPVYTRNCSSVSRGLTNLCLSPAAEGVCIRLTLHDESALSFLERHRLVVVAKHNALPHDKVLWKIHALAHKPWVRLIWRRAWRWN